MWRHESQKLRRRTTCPLTRLRMRSKWIIGLFSHFWLIGVLRCFQKKFSHINMHGQLKTYSCVSWLPHISNPHNKPSKQLAAFPHRLFTHWWKTNDACNIVFYLVVSLIPDQNFPWIYRSSLCQNLYGPNWQLVKTPLINWPGLKIVTICSTLFNHFDHMGLLTAFYRLSQIDLGVWAK